MNHSKKHKEPYCSKCKTKKGPLIRYAKTGPYQYFQCRKCNTKRARVYRETPEGRLKVNMAVYKSTIKHLDKQKARILLNSQVKRRLVIRPNTCNVCQKKKKTEAHHTDYTKPLMVTWVCRQCHFDLHKITN